MRYLKTATIIGLSLLFVACQKEDIEVQGGHEDHTIMTFEPQMKVEGGAVTRGTPITAVSQMTDMGVFVYHTGNSQWATAGATATSNVMNNMNVAQAAGKWSYAPIQPWQNQYNTIFAYAPFATTTNGITVQSSYTGAPTIEYTVPTTCANQPDLMVAVTQADKYLGTVSFEMEHALACVGFKVNGRYEEAITKIAIKGASVSGTLSLDHTTDGVPQWTDVAAATDTEYTSGVKGGFVGNAAMSDVLNVDGYLMMIPQTLGVGAKLIVTVDGVDREVKLDGKEWKAGEQYTYNIEIPYDPIIIGYFGGWNGTEYTKQLQVDWEIPSRDLYRNWWTNKSITNATDFYYGPTNIDILKELSPDLSDYPAAKYCEDKNKGDGWDKGSDWYLPSLYQIMGIRVASEAIPYKFRLSSGSDVADYTRYPYASSTERIADSNDHPAFDYTGYIYYCYFQDDFIQGTSALTYRIRCVRDVTP